MIIKLDGRQVSEGSVLIPKAGLWTATLTTDTYPVTLRGAGTILIQDAVELVGTVQAVSICGAKQTARIIGGYGNTSNALVGRAYSNVSVRVVISDILRECGEDLSDDCDSVLDLMLPVWFRKKGTAREAITRLCDSIGMLWRAQRDRSIWVGSSPTPVEYVLPRGFVMVDDRASDGIVVITADALDVTPGETLWEGREVISVEYRLDKTRLLAVLCLQ